MVVGLKEMHQRRGVWRGASLYKKRRGNWEEPSRIYTSQHWDLYKKCEVYGGHGAEIYTSYNSEGTGGGGRRGASAAEPRGGRKGAGERSMAERRERGGRAAHTPSIADGTALRNIVGEEVAATLKTSVSYDMGSFFYVWLRYKKKMSERSDDHKPWTIVNTLLKGGEISF